MAPEAREISIAEIEGPQGTAEIVEVTVPASSIVEVEYAVVFNGKRESVTSLGEAHLLANRMVGIEQGL